MQSHAISKNNEVIKNRDITYTIFLFFSIKDLLKFGQVNRLWFEMSLHQRLWVVERMRLNQPKELIMCEPSYPISTTNQYTLTFFDYKRHVENGKGILKPQNSPPSEFLGN